jgi:hypothetical protein
MTSKNPVFDAALQVIEIEKAKKPPNEWEALFIKLVKELAIVVSLLAAMLALTILLPISLLSTINFGHIAWCFSALNSGVGIYVLLFIWQQTRHKIKCNCGVTFEERMD